MTDHPAPERDQRPPQGGLFSGPVLPLAPDQAEKIAIAKRMHQRPPQGGLSVGEIPTFHYFGIILDAKTGNAVSCESHDHETCPDCNFSKDA